MTRQRKGATAIALLANQRLGGIGLNLDAAAVVSGVVRDLSSNVLSGINVEIYNAAGDLLSSAQTDTNGAYSVGGVPAGTYYVRTGTSGTYTDKWFSNILVTHNNPVTNGATALNLSAGVNTTGVDFAIKRLAALVLGIGPINGGISVSWDVQAGETYQIQRRANLGAGSWVNAPTTGAGQLSSQQTAGSNGVLEYWISVWVAKTACFIGFYCNNRAFAVFVKN